MIFIAVEEEIVVVAPYVKRFSVTFKEKGKQQ
jgi:hypothetical protein